MQDCHLGDHLGIAPVRVTDNDQAQGLMVDLGNLDHLLESLETPAVLFTREFLNNWVISGEWGQQVIVKLTIYN